MSNPPWSQVIFQQPIISPCQCVCTSGPMEDNSNNFIFFAGSACPTLPVVTVESIGRIGNQLSIYSTMWCLARENKGSIAVYLPSSLLTYLDKWFPNLSLPSLEILNHCNITFTNITFADLGNIILPLD